ncbi:MAG: DsbA family protein [Pseudomonadales bacterium]
MLEPTENPNSAWMVDPPRILRFVMARIMGRVANTRQIQRKREVFERRRRAGQQPHEIEYFHQLDDPYSHLMAQVLAKFSEQYDVRIVPHLIRATGGKNQPEAKKLARWARRDAELIAPHYGLTFPSSAGVVPDPAEVKSAAQALAGLDAKDFITAVQGISDDLWAGLPIEHAEPIEAVEQALESGSNRLKTLGHYSGATLYYGGEWYWGVDRLFHLEQRLRDLGACHVPETPYLVPRPSLNVEGIDASGLALHFFPSLNSPYTAIIFDRTVKLAKACNIAFHHKPVLPMIMRGVAATKAKGSYIFFDTKREADVAGVPFGNHMTPIGSPTRRAYSLMPWAKSLDKDVDLLSHLLRLAFAEGKALHQDKNLRLAVEAAGLDWTEALKHIGSDDWKSMVEGYQDEMVEGMGLWGVPSYRLSGPDGEPDLEVWGQDRLWLVAAEIRRRAKRLTIESQ